MKDNYDFSKGIKNPYADRLKQGYTVTVHYGFTDENARKEDECEKGTGNKSSAGELPFGRSRVKGKIQMAEDLDAPPEDFKEYME
jgi:hypothetical protein